MLDTGKDIKHVPELHVRSARVLMREGMSLRETAVALGVRSCDLDVALWRGPGETKRPMFEG
jgi:hypothetical protein